MSENKKPIIIVGESSDKPELWIDGIPGEEFLKRYSIQELKDIRSAVISEMKKDKDSKLYLNKKDATN